MVGMAGGIVDANQFSDYVKVGDKLAIALLRHAEALERQHEVRHTNALEELAEKIDSLRNERAERPHRREKNGPTEATKPPGRSRQSRCGVLRVRQKITRLGGIGAGGRETAEPGQQPCPNC
jgi:hypothetical protein